MNPMVYVNMVVAICLVIASILRGYVVFTVVNAALFCLQLAIWSLTRKLDMRGSR